MKMRIALEEAQELLKNHAGSAGVEEVLLMEAHGRVLAEDFFSPMDQPPFDRSPVDGYALRAVDSKGADSEHPVTLKVIEEIFAGALPHKEIRSGTAARIMTGTPIPKGADCVIRQEQTSGGDDTVDIFQELSAFENYCNAGEDVRKGVLILKEGTLLNFIAVGNLAALGMKEVRVYRRPRVAVLSTGDELVDVGTELPPGKIYNSNLYTIGMRLKELGFEPILLDSAPDEAGELGRHIRKALENADFLITTGGVSVGKKDIVKDALDLIGADILFWRINMKPGTPVMCGVLDGKLIFGLSGNPAAATINFELLVREVLAQYSHRKDISLKQGEAVLRDDFSKNNSKRRMARGKLIRTQEGDFVELPSKHSAGSLSSFVGCNCIVEIAAGTPPLKQGQRVKIFLL